MGQILPTPKFGYLSSILEADSFYIYRFTTPKEAKDFFDFTTSNKANLSSFSDLEVFDESDAKSGYVKLISQSVGAVHNTLLKLLKPDGVLKENKEFKLPTSV